MNSISDTKLIDLIRKGNELAFSELFDRYWENLLDLALKTLKDEDSSKDVVQDVFADLWNRRYSINIKNLAGYLNKAIRFRAIDHIRKNKISMMSLDYVDQFKEINTTQELMDFKDLEINLEEYVAQLSPQCRIVFKMSRFEDQSYKSISEKLGISVRTVETHISNALKQIRIKLNSDAVLSLILMETGYLIVI